ncbi:MAG: Uma2 family endonuclease [Planctomycetaceae bacterium]|nr:Uma2 family endonuclease [Planctomycetaceae bacterium]
MPTTDVSPTRLTYQDYVLFPNDGNRHEIINGRHYMNAAPSPRHQAISRHIQFQLYQQIELKGLGAVIDAPIDVQLSESDVVQPDLVVILSENHIITPTRVKGVPDLVIEVLSASQRAHDLQLKKQLYEQAGVPEYWIVDPENQTATKYVLTTAMVYDEGTVETAEITWKSSVGDFPVDLVRVW